MCHDLVLFAESLDTLAYQESKQGVDGISQKQVKQYICNLCILGTLWVVCRTSALCGIIATKRATIASLIG